MRKKPKVGSATPTMRIFQPGWLALYSFMRYDPEVGVWCYICHKFKPLMYK